MNAVALRGFTEEEALPFAEFARSTSYQVRFIEFMPLDGDHAWSSDQVLPGDEIRAIIDRVHPLEELPREPHSTARVFRFADGRGEIGFINPVSEPFCADCNRIRLTADGKLRTCLFSIHETDLRAPLRDGASDAELAERRPRRRLAQGAEAPRGRAGLPPAAAHDVGDRWLTYTLTVRAGAKVRKEQHRGLDDALPRSSGRGVSSRQRRRAPGGRHADPAARAGADRGRAAGAGRAPAAARRRRRARRRLERGLHRPAAAPGRGAARRREPLRRAAPGAAHEPLARAAAGRRRAADPGVRERRPAGAGRDYELVGRELIFDRPLEKERLSKGKWTAIFFGLWGYYGKNDSVDVQYRVGGRETVATGLEIIPPEG